MNLKEREAWLDATNDCFPDLRTSELRSSLEGLDSLGFEGSWEGGISGSGFELLALRFFPKACGDWLGRAAGLFGISGQATWPKPCPSWPALTLLWNLRSGEWEKLLFCGQDGAKGARALGLLRLRGKARVRLLLERGPFRPRAFREPALEQALREFAGLCPVSAMITEKEEDQAGRWVPRPSWALRLEEGQSWPDFMRCDMAKGFGAQPSQLSFLMLGREVRELVFDGESLWAFCSS